MDKIVLMVMIAPTAAAAAAQVLKMKMHMKNTLLMTMMMMMMMMLVEVVVVVSVVLVVAVLFGNEAVERSKNPWRFALGDLASLFASQHHSKNICARLSKYVSHWRRSVTFAARHKIALPARRRERRELINEVMFDR
uniref:Uncharacterized protein n=1 Tax=Anopheles maculatus TaxID=74869 RepID=A0A182TA81_9DIPT